MTHGRFYVRPVKEVAMSVVVLTGCSSGIGRSAALTFARQRHRVYATMRDPSRGERLAKAAAEEDLDLTVARLDVTDDGSVLEATRRVLELEGRIDILVNNAAVDHFGTVECMPEHLVRSIFETNVFGPVRLIRAVLPTMRTQRSGTIVNVSSLAGRVPTVPVHGFYAASKHSLSVLSEALALEVESFGIRVVCIEPGFIATDFMAKAERPNEGSPYRALEDAVVGTCEREIVLGPEPQIVANAILETANGTSDGSVHVLVGEDAEEYTEAYRSLSELEYTALVREYVGMKPVA
jgi:NAD(P)-dependent dehydrogenase (short-subunit alcohol dehydrogenase family)